GISRYGLSLLATAVPQAVEAGWRMIVVTRPAQEYRARQAAAHLGIPVLVCPDNEGFVRRSPWMRSILAQSGADLYFSTHYTVDRHCPVPFVFTIHDLTRLRFPEFSYTDAAFAERFGAAELRLLRDELAELAPESRLHDSPLFPRYFRALNQFLIHRARRIITVSHAAASDIRHLLGASDTRLDLVPCAVDTAVFHSSHREHIDAVRTARGLTGPYLVFVGLTHPNKRFEWLLHHLLQARDTFPHGTRLVAVGGHAETTPHVRATLRRSGAEDFVTFTGRVSDGELAALYSGAAAYVTASISEGYGMPPAEALACGSQVIATDIPALRESLGESAHFYPAQDAATFVALARDALRGCLPDRAARPPTADWATSGASLIRALSRALDDSPPAPDPESRSRQRAHAA
ncbi:MAG: glycosyltransferase family 4 protein, partial [Sciscionella sp.]